MFVVTYAFRRFNVTTDYANYDVIGGQKVTWKSVKWKSTNFELSKLPQHQCLWTICILKLFSHSVCWSTQERKFINWQVLCGWYGVLVGYYSKLLIVSLSLEALSSTSLSSSPSLLTPHLGVYYFLSLTLSVCPRSVCISRCFFKSILPFRFSTESNPFLTAISPCGTLQNIVLQFLITPPNAQNLLPKICTVGHWVSHSL